MSRGDAKGQRDELSTVWRWLCRCWGSNHGMHEWTSRRRRVAYREGGGTARSQILPAVWAHQVQRRKHVAGPHGVTSLAVYDQSDGGIDHISFGCASGAHVARQHAKRQCIDALLRQIGLS
jgi:hypothetical protein